MSREKTVIVISVGALVVAAGAVYFATRPRVADGLKTGLAWKQGSQYTYDFRYRSEDRVQVAVDQPMDPKTDEMQPFRGRFDLEGKLVLRAYGQKDGVFHLGLRLSDVKRHVFSVMDKDVLPTDGDVKRTMEGHEALLNVNAQGRVLRMYFDPSAPSLYNQTVAAIIGETILHLALGKATWSATEKNSRGVAGTVYTLVDVDSRRATLTREKETYQKLSAVMVPLERIQQNVDASADIVLSHAGHLETLSSREKLDVYATSGKALLSVSTATELELARIDRFADAGKTVAFFDAVLKTLQTRRAYRVGQSVLSPEAEKNLLGKISGGLSLDDFANMLRAQASGSKLPQNFIWRFSALLELEPELCTEMFELFRDPALSGRGRSAIVATLVATGHKEAQAVLRQMLDTSEAQNDPRYPLMLSKLSFIREPDEDTLNYILGRYRSNPDDSKVREAAAYALGAGVANAYREENKEAALRFSRDLIAELQNARSAKHQEILLGALGNAGLHENLGAVLAFGKSEDARIRQEVADALRKTQSHNSENLLLTLAGDESYAVQRTAMNSLKRYRLGPTHFEALRKRIEEKRVNELSYIELVQLLKAQNKTHQRQIKAIMQTMLDQGIKHPKVQRLVRETYDQMV